MLRRRKGSGMCVRALATIRGVSGGVQRCRAGGPGTPSLAIVSRSLRLDWGSTAFSEPAPDAPTMIVTCRAADADALDRAWSAAQVVVAGEQSVDLSDARVQLRRLGHEVVLCEGWPTLLGRLTAGGLLDELCLAVSPMMGGGPLPLAITPQGGGVTPLDLWHVAADGGSLFLRYETGRHAR